MENETHNDGFSIAVDKALLKLSKKYNISLPHDDYVLVQLFLNKEVLSEMLESEVESLVNENQKSKVFFRKALIELTKQHDSQLKTLEKFFENRFKKLIFTSLTISTIALLISTILLILNFIGS